MNDKKLYTNINKNWKDYRLDDEAFKKPLDETIDKRGLAWLADAITVSLIGNHKTGIAQITKRQDIIRKYVNENNFDKAHRILYEEITMALRKAAIKFEKMGDE